MEECASQRLCERQAICQVSPDSVLQGLVQTFDPSICLWVVERRADVFNPFIFQEGGELGRDELRPIICSDGFRLLLSLYFYLTLKQDPY